MREEISQDQIVHGLKEARIHFGECTFRLVIVALSVQGVNNLCVCVCVRSRVLVRIRCAVSSCGAMIVAGTKAPAVEGDSVP